MACDMCGEGKSTAIISVEGVEMGACQKCSKQGNYLRKIQAPRKPKKSAPEPEETIEEVRPDIGVLLRNHRESKGFTPEHFAQKLGIKLSTYNHFESGSATPDRQTIARLERVLKTRLVKDVEVGQVDLEHDDTGVTIGDLIKRKR